MGLLVAFAPDHCVSGVDQLRAPTLLDPLVALKPVNPAPPCGELNPPDEVRRQNAKLGAISLRACGLCTSGEQRRDMAERFTSDRPVTMIVDRWDSIDRLAGGVEVV